MVDTCLIDRRGAQVRPDDSRVRTADTAEVLLEMLCDAMRVLNSGGAADQVVCRHLARGLRADTAVTFALAPDSQVRTICVQPELRSTHVLAEALLDRLDGDGPDLRIEYTESFGHIASLCGQVLTGQHQHGWAGCIGQSQFPAFSGFHSVARAEYRQIRDRPQRGHMFHRLVGWAVFTQANRIMGKHKNRVDFHQRGHPQGIAGVFAKHQKGCAIRL